MKGEKLAKKITEEIERIGAGEDIGPCDSIVAHTRENGIEIGDDGHSVYFSEGQAERVLLGLQSLPDAGEGLIWENAYGMVWEIIGSVEYEEDGAK